LANPRHISCISKIYSEIRNLLSIIHFYTITEDEIQCWMLRYGSSIIDAAIKIDVQLAREFLRSEVISYEDWLELEGNRMKLNVERKIRNEGRKYLVNDGDILAFFASEPK
jgi:ribosome-binding ATPase YchF (GTP1/OBG family)